MSNLKFGKKKKERHAQLPQNSLFTSPRDTVPQALINQMLKQKYVDMKRREKVQLTRKTISRMHSRHHTVQYKKQFNFKQKWQEQNEKEAQKFKVDGSLYESSSPIIIKYINLFLYLANYWLISIYRIFKIDHYLEFLIPFIVVSQVLDLIFKKQIQMVNIKSYPYKKQNVIKWILKMHWFSITICLYALILIVQKTTGYYNQFVIVFTLLDFILAILCYNRFLELYSTVKLQILSSKYRNQVYLMQLFGKCCNIVHISSIALILASFVNNELNWTLGIAQFNRGWISKYIYSVYFSCTTVFTIGYGDIAPKNLLEICVILVVQAVGVINLGYIFSEIGRILAKINEDQQNLLKNMYQAQKVIQTYKLPNSLAIPMKDEILHHDLAHQKLNMQDEENLLRMLNDDLRQNVIFANQIHIIKHSIFFICNWSVRFQRKIANKLIRCTYKPEEHLHQTRGQQKIYILTLGKLHIVPCLSNKAIQVTHQPIRKLQYKQNDEVQINTFGYSFLVSGLNIKLRAITKDYSICYNVSKEDFINTMLQDDKDFQYFHEIKNRLQTSIIKQIWQAPKLGDHRQHYRPNIYYMIKKYNKELTANQSRKYKFRRTNKLNFYIQTQVKEATDDDIVSKEILTQAEIQEVIDRNKILTEKERSAKYSSINSNKRPLITFRSYKMKNSIKKQSSLENDLFLQLNLIVDHLNNFDQGKNYSSFFTKFNLQNSIAKYNNTFCQSKEPASFKQISTIRYSEYKLFDQSEITREMFTKLAQIRIIEK